MKTRSACRVFIVGLVQPWLLYYIMLRCLRCWNSCLLHHTFTGITTHCLCKHIPLASVLFASEAVSLKRKTGLIEFFKCFCWGGSHSVEWKRRKIIHLMWQAVIRCNIHWAFHRMFAMPFIRSGSVSLASNFIVLWDLVHYHYVSALFSSRLYKASFTTPSSFIFHWPGLVN